MIKVKTKNGKTKVEMSGYGIELLADTVCIVTSISDSIFEERPEFAALFRLKVAKALAMIENGKIEFKKEDK